MWPGSVKQLVQTLHKDTPWCCFCGFYLVISPCCRHPWGGAPPHCPLRCIVKQAEFQARPQPIPGLLSIFSRKTAPNGFAAMPDQTNPDFPFYSMTVQTSSYTLRRRPHDSLVTVCAWPPNVARTPQSLRHGQRRPAAHITYHSEITCVLTRSSFESACASCLKHVTPHPSTYASVPLCRHLPQRSAAPGGFLPRRSAFRPRAPRPCHLPKRTFRARWYATSPSQHRFPHARHQRFPVRPSGTGCRVPAGTL